MNKVRKKNGIKHGKLYQLLQKLKMHNKQLNSEKLHTHCLTRMRTRKKLKQGRGVFSEVF